MCSSSRDICCWQVVGVQDDFQYLIGYDADFESSNSVEDDGKVLHFHMMEAWAVKNEVGCGFFFL